MREWINLVENVLNEELPMPVNLASMSEIVEFVFDNTDWSGGSGDQLMDEFRHEHKLHPYDDEVDVKSPEFIEWMKGWVEDHVWDAWGNFQHLFDGEGNATLYRVIMAPHDWKPDAQHPGIYWSWDESAAEAHWGDFKRGNVKWLMTAKVNTKAVDWTATLAMNVQPDYAREKEIRIKENAPVELINVERI